MTSSDLLSLRTTSSSGKREETHDARWRVYGGGGQESFDFWPEFLQRQSTVGRGSVVMVKEQSPVSYFSGRF